MPYKYIVSVCWENGLEQLIPVEAENQEGIIKHFIANSNRQLSEADYFHIYKLEKLNIEIK